MSSRSRPIRTQWPFALLAITALLLVGASVPALADDLDSQSGPVQSTPGEPDLLGDGIRELLAELARMPGVEVLNGPPVRFEQTLPNDPPVLAPERFPIIGFLADDEAGARAGDDSPVLVWSLIFQSVTVSRASRRECGCPDPDLNERLQPLDLGATLEAGRSPEVARAYGGAEAMTLALAAALRGHTNHAVAFLKAVLTVNSPDRDDRQAQLKDLRRQFYGLLWGFTWRHARDPSWTLAQGWRRVRTLARACPELDEGLEPGFEGLLAEWAKRRADVVEALQRRCGWRALSKAAQAEVLVALLPEELGIDPTKPGARLLSGTEALVEGPGRTSPAYALGELGLAAIPALLEGNASDFPTRSGQTVAFHCRAAAQRILGVEASEFGSGDRGPEAARAWRGAILQGLRKRETLGEGRWLAECFARTGAARFGERLAAVAPERIFESHRRALARGTVDSAGICRRLLRCSGEPGRRLVAEFCTSSDPRLALTILPRSDLAARARAIAWWHEAIRRQRLRIAEARRWIAGEPRGGPVDLTAPWGKDSGQGPALLHPDAFAEAMIQSDRPELIAAVAQAIPSLDAARREVILLTLNPRASSACVRALSQEICRACLDDHRPITLVDLEDLPVRVCDLATSKLLQLRSEPGCALGHVEPERREAARLALKRRLATGRRDDRRSLCRRPRPHVARRLHEFVQDALRQGPPPDDELARLSRRDRRGLSEALRSLGPEANPLRLALCRTGAVLNSVEVDPRGLPVAESCLASLALQKGEPLNLAELVAPLSRAFKAPEPAEHDGWGRPRPGRLTLTLRRRPGEPGFRAIVRADADPVEVGPAFFDGVPPHPLEGVFRLGLRKGHRGLTYDDDLDSVERRAEAIGPYAEAVEWTLGADAGGRGVEIAIDVAARLAPAPTDQDIQRGIRLRD